MLSGQQLKPGCVFSACWSDKLSVPLDTFLGTCSRHQAPLLHRSLTPAARCRGKLALHQALHCRPKLCELGGLISPAAKGQCQLPLHQALHHTPQLGSLHSLQRTMHLLNDAGGNLVSRWHMSSTLFSQCGQFAPYGSTHLQRFFLDGRRPTPGASYQLVHTGTHLTSEAGKSGGQKLLLAPLCKVQDDLLLPGFLPYHIAPLIEAVCQMAVMPAAQGQRHLTITVMLSTAQSAEIIDVCLYNHMLNIPTVHKTKQ